MVMEFVKKIASVTNNQQPIADISKNKSLGD